MPIDLEPPAHLIETILRGRCVAFVGAGFAAGVMPTWSKLLAAIAEELGIPVTIPVGASGFENEAVGQALQDAVSPERWEQAVRDVLARALAAASPDARAQLDKRTRLLTSIPFKAILTTNFDPSIDGQPTTPSVRARVLREERRWWFDAPAPAGHLRPRAPVVKLHGHANGDPATMPLVLSRAAYRQRLYDDHNYANFIRSVFAGYTVLFLGVSFTDAYLNEIRSEVLHLVRSSDDEHPWGYAVMYRPAESLETFLLKHEGIRSLPITEYAEFDDRLEAIARRASLRGRLASLLKGKFVVWVDDTPDNNERGRRLLLESGARVEQLSSHDALDEAHHGSADLLLTKFGHLSGRAFAVLDRLRSWPTRPPVIVFAAQATPAQVAANRAACLRRGGWEYTTAWGELYRAIEQLLGRTPGRQV